MWIDIISLQVFTHLYAYVGMHQPDMDKNEKNILLVKFHVILNIIGHMETL
jgi:hypothetical protein